MSKKGKAAAIAVSVVAGVLIIAIIAASIAAVVGTFSRRRGYMSYNDIRYERPDFDAIDEAFEDAIYLAEHGSAYSAVSAMNEATTLLNELVTAVGYANIEYQKDYTDVFWRNEYAALYNQYNSSYVDYCTMMYTALTGPNGDTLFSGDWTEADKQQIIDEYESIGAGYEEGQAEILEITTEYTELSASGGSSVYATESDAREYSDKTGELLIRLARAYNELYPDGDYAERAYASYGRAYTPEDVEEMRACVKGYLGKYVSLLYDTLGNDGFDVYFGSVPVSSSADRVVADFFADVCSREAVSGVDTGMTGYLTDAFEYMTDCDLYYRSTNPNGNTGAFTSYLQGYEIPYLFQYVTGSADDTSTFVHEFGHFSSFYLNGAYGGLDLDVAEVQSQALEMMFVGRYDELYGGLSSSDTSGDGIVEAMTVGDMFNSLVFSIVMGCVLDELQYDVYTNTQAYTDGSDVTEKYSELLAEYGMDAELTEEFSSKLGYKYDYFRYWWAAVPHTFESPFYYISYAMSAVPAFAVYVDSLSDFTAAANEYNYIQKYGDGTYTFEKLLENAGVGSPFEEDTYEEIAGYLDTLV